MAHLPHCSHISICRLAIISIYCKNIINKLISSAKSDLFNNFFPLPPIHRLADFFEHLLQGVSTGDGIPINKTRTDKDNLELEVIVLIRTACLRKWRWDYGYPRELLRTLFPLPRRPLPWKTWCQPSRNTMHQLKKPEQISWYHSG